MKKTIPKLLTLVCLLVAVMGLSIVTAHAATVTGTVSSGNEYRYHEDKTPVPQWGPYTSNKLKYFTRNDTGETVPAYCVEPEVRSASGDLQYSSTSWSDLTWNQRYAVTLAMAYGYGGNYGFNMHPDCAQLATQAVVWEFVCGYRSPVYPYTLYDTTCANLFHYAGDDVAVAYNIIIDRIMNHGKIPSFAVKYYNQLSDANAIMPREMTALQTADALVGLFDAASQLVSALLDACRMPCCKNCDSDVREFDLDAVPAPIRKLLLDSGCCPSLLECYLEEGDVVYAAE